MDWSILIIGFLLIWIGAYFFGYPIGKIVGKRQKQREFEENNVIYPLPECVKHPRRTVDSGDVLLAEYLEEKQEAKKR